MLISVLVSLPVSSVVSLRKVVSSDIMTVVTVINGVGFGIIDGVGAVEIDIVGVSPGIVVIIGIGVGCVAGGVCIGILPIVVGETEVGCGVDGGVVVVVDVES